MRQRAASPWRSIASATRCLVAAPLEVDDEVDVGVARAGGPEVRETLVEGVHGAAPRRVLGVVGEQQLAAAVAALGDDVELDRVDPGEQRGLKRRERVAGCDVVGALVADAPHT